MHKLKISIALLICFFSAVALPQDFEAWVDKHRQQSLELLLKNISPPATALGVVVASPSKVKPDYWYHWVRDAALVMDVMVEMYRRSLGSEKER